MACRLLVKKAAASPAYSFMKKISTPCRGYATGTTTTMACGMWAASPVSSPYRGYATTGTACGLWKKAPSSSNMNISAPYRGYSTGMMMVWWMWVLAAVSCMKIFVPYRGRTIARLTVDGSFKIRHHAHARALGLHLDEKFFFRFSCDLDVEYADIHKWATIHFKTHGNLVTIIITDHKGDVLWNAEVDIIEEEEAKH